MVKLYDENSIVLIEWATKRDGEVTRNYFEPLMKHGIKKYIKNIATDIYLLEIDDVILPISVNTQEFTNSYVVSPYTHYISYAKEELWELGNKHLEALLSRFIDLIGIVLQKSNINKVVIVNNWFLSTNLYPTLSNTQITRLTVFLVAEFPQHTILFRSINQTLHNKMIKGLKEEGYKSIMSRSIYLFNPSLPLTKRQKKALYQDEKLITKFNYNIKDIEKDDDYLTIENLYKQLYIDKYSINNPQFTHEFFKYTNERHLLHFKLLCQNSKIIGVTGNIIRDGVLTTPILGYVVKSDKKSGLYRVLSGLITKEILDKQYFGHRSAGASEFKRNRGSVQEIEYSYFYQKHLSLISRVAWCSIKLIMDIIIVPLAKKKKF